jgi:uncharacterized membrane protein
LKIDMRLSYVIVPIAILLLSVALSAYFYPLLPAEVAYHFEPDGTPDRWLSREMTMFWVLALQLVFVLLGGGIAWGVTKLSTLFGQTGNTKIKPERLVLFTGNFVALPQLIICFAMVDIFSYNSYQVHLMPMWVFLLVVLGLVTISLVMFGVLILSKVRGGQRG